MTNMKKFNNRMHSMGIITTGRPDRILNSPKPKANRNLNLNLNQLKPIDKASENLNHKPAPISLGFLDRNSPKANAHAFGERVSTIESEDEVLGEIFSLMRSLSCD